MPRQTTFPATGRTAPQRCAVVIVIAALHLLAAVWMLRPSIRTAWAPSHETVLQVDWIAAADTVAAPAAVTAPVAAPAPMPPARPPARAPSPLLSSADAFEAQAITAVASPVVESTADDRVAPAEVAAPAQAATSMAPAAAHAEAAVALPAPPAELKNLPAESVRYLVPPAPVYPRLSRRQGEAGRVLVRVYIDEAGLPRTVQLSASSGHGRLDDAALKAVLQARFKPYAENGRPLGGWALIPLTFDLEK